MKKYIEPEIKLYEFLKADVIRTSGEGEQVVDNNDVIGFDQEWWG